MIDTLREWLGRCLASFRRKRMDGELDAEMQAHLQFAIDENIRRGVPPEEARRLAHIGFGGIEPAKELQRDARGWPTLDATLQDLRYTLRGLRRDAGFTIFAILIVGLGIGASAVVFSVFDRLLIRPLPFRDPGQLAWIQNTEGAGLSDETVRVNGLLGLRAHNTSFEGIAGYYAFYGVGDSKLIGEGEPERLSEVPVTQNFFPLLGVQPAIGRLFTRRECLFNGPKAVLLSHALWERRFASDRGILGRSLRLNNADVTVIGVLPPSFDFGSIFAPGQHIDLFSPFPLSAETDRQGNTLAMIGRLRPGATVRRAQAELLATRPFINTVHPEWGRLKLAVGSLADHVSGSLRPALVVLACAVGAVMLLVCANLSNLLLARAASRQKEVAIRAALGAGRARLIRQMLTESVFLSCCGALLGLLLAYGGLHLLAHAKTLSIPLLAEVKLDAGGLAFIVAAALLTGILFGLLPALQTRDLKVSERLKETGRGSSTSRQREWTRQCLVVAEIVFACVLLVGAGLLIRSFLRVLDVNLGFQPERAAAIRVDPDARYRTQAQRNGYFDEALRLARNIPSIKGAALSDSLPLGTNRSWTIQIRGRHFEPGHEPDVFVRIVSDGYLHAMGMALDSGRDFTARDLPASDPVIIINHSMAESLWPSQNPLGQIINADRDRRIVGIAGDVRHLALERGAGYEMYLPLRQTNDYDRVDLVIRTALPPAQFAAAVRSALQPLDPNLPANDFRPLQQMVDKAISPRRFVVMLLGGFAGFALILAFLGIYAVISYSVSQHTQEIGIRMALGATAGNLQARILKQTLALAAAGMLVGTILSWLLARALSSLLFGITPADPLTFAAMLAVLAAVAALAGYVPAVRASRIDPMVALRTS